MGRPGGRAMRSTALIGGTIAWIASGIAFAGTITQPTGNPFVVPGNASGAPLPFTITASGFMPGSLVYVEQCDGTPATAQGWSPTANCDLGSSPAAAIVSGNGVATFAASDTNHAFHPFEGVSPQGLINCLSPHDPSPNNGLPDFRTCQIRVSSNNSAITADQAFLPIQLPDTVPVTTTTTTTTVPHGTTTITSPLHPTTTSTTIPPCPAGSVTGAVCQLNRLTPATLCAPSDITPALLHFITTKLDNARSLLQAAQTKMLAHGKPPAINRLERTAAMKLKQILPRVARDARRKKISPACQQALTQHISPLRDEVLGLRSRP